MTDGVTDTIAHTPTPSGTEGTGCRGPGDMLVRTLAPAPGSLSTRQTTISASQGPGPWGSSRPAGPGSLPLTSFPITSSAPPETSDVFKNRKINNVVPQRLPPTSGPPNEVLASLAGAPFPGFRTLCRPRARRRLHRDAAPAAQKGCPVAGVAGVGGGVCGQPGAAGRRGSTQLGCRDTGTQAPEVQAKPAQVQVQRGFPGTLPCSQLWAQLLTEPQAPSVCN